MREKNVNFSQHTFVRVECQLKRASESWNYTFSVSVVEGHSLDGNYLSFIARKSQD